MINNKLCPRLRLPHYPHDIIYPTQGELRRQIVALEPEMKMFFKEKVLPHMSNAIEAFIVLRDCGGTAHLGAAINPGQMRISSKKCAQIAKEYAVAQKIILKALKTG